VSSYGVFANNLHGKIDIDPYYFYYNNNKLATYSSKNLTLGVKPSDSYSTEDATVTRSLNGNCDADVLYTTQVNGIYKPFFKNLQGALNYVINNGLIGNALNIAILENIVEGEDTNKALSPNASGVYLNQTVYGNLVGGYFSTEWLGTHYPELTSNGILGGNFYWGADNTGAWGSIYHLSVSNYINFKSVSIYGMFEIGSKVNSDKSKYWDTRKPFDAAPPVVSIRSYFCSNTSKRFADFGSSPSDRVYNFTTTIGSDPRTWNRPFNIGFPGPVYITNLGVEFANNASDNTNFWINQGNARTQFSNTSIALKGPGNFYYSPILTQNFGGINYILGTRQIDPFHLDQWHWPQNLWSTIPGNGGPNYYPGYGLAIIGNDGKTTFQQNPTLSYTAAINFNSGPSQLWVIDQGQNIGPIGKDSPIQSSIIFDGMINTSCFYRVYKGSYLLSDNQIYKTSNFFLSSCDTTVDPNTRIVSLNYNSKFDFIPFEPGTARDGLNNIYWRQVPVKSWNVLQNNNSLTYTDYNSLLAVSNGRTPWRFDTSTKTFDYTAFIKSYSSFVSQGGNNYNVNQVNADKSNGPRTISYVNFNQLSAYDTQGLYTQTSPLCSTFTSTMAFYKAPTR